MIARRTAHAALLALAVATSAPALRAQAGIEVGSPFEGYLRALHTDSSSVRASWSLRPFGPREERALLPDSGMNAWSSLLELERAERSSVRGMLRWRPLPVAIESWYNSDFPYGYNDGAVWRGRGVTVAARAGVHAAVGPVQLRLAPVAFWAQNRSFTLARNGRTGALRFANPAYPMGADMPQRFGDGRYARLDPGQSTIRVDLAGIAAGFSTANQWWGPMQAFPFILGNNAAGFPHAFLGSSHSWNVWIGRIHGRILMGQLGQTAFTAIPDSLRRRLGVGTIGTFTPRGIPSLEIGAARWYHAIWPAGGLEWYHLRRPFEPFLKSRLRVRQTVTVDSTVHGNQDSENQLASVFFRWAAPRSGFEVYGEYGREDHSWDATDFLRQPDHSATYGLGMARSWRRPDAMTVLRAELMSFQPGMLARYRGEGGIYLHSEVRQGHTQRGELLGAPIGLGSGAGATVTLDRYDATGRMSITWMRTTPLDRNVGRRTTDPALSFSARNALGVERTLSRGSLEYTAGLTGIHETNRNFTGTALGLAASFAVRWLPR